MAVQQRARNLPGPPGSGLGWSPSCHQGLSPSRTSHGRGQRGSSSTSAGRWSCGRGWWPGEELDNRERGLISEVLFQTSNHKDFDYTTDDPEDYGYDDLPIPGAREYKVQRYAAAVTRCTEDDFVRSAIESEFLDELARRIDARLYGEGLDVGADLDDSEVGLDDGVDCSDGGEG